MPLIDQATQPIEEWRPGVRTVMLVSAVTGSKQLCVFEQFCDPGLGAPTHLHAVEEVLTVVAGDAEIWVGEPLGHHPGGPVSRLPQHRRGGVARPRHPGRPDLRSELRGPERTHPAVGAVDAGPRIS